MGARITELIYSSALVGGLIYLGLNVLFGLPVEIKCHLPPLQLRQISGFLCASYFL